MHRDSDSHERFALDVLEASRRVPSIRAAVPYEMGRLHAAAGRIDLALTMFEAALALEPTFADAHWERGVLLERRGQIDEALESWRRGRVFGNAHRHSLYLVASLKSPASTNESLLAAHKEWARYHAVPLFSVAQALPTWTQGEPITIGYACSFWDTDTIRFQLLPLLRRHDRRRFRVIAYSNSEPGPVVKAAVDEIRVVGALQDEEYVRLVRKDGVHILVEVTGHSYGHRFAAMAARCAPVQISYLNYTSTCGVDAVDYIIGDDIAIPRGTDAAFTEEVFRLPGCFFCFTYEGAALPPVSPPPSLACGHVTFGCFGSGGKINAALLDLWAAILQRTPTSRLFIRNGELTPADNRRVLLEAFGRRGIDPARLLLLPGTNRQGVLESYARVDVSLDTFPYCGGNTIAESLWQGVPVVTLKGDRFSSAYGASLLAASGLPELVAETPDEYVRKAVELAGDANRLRWYRVNLRSFVERYGFSDADRFATTMEAAYRDMLAKKLLTEPREHAYA